MVANVNPRFPEAGVVQWGTTAITAANTAKDGTGTVTTVFTADALDGSWVRGVLWQPAGTNVVSVGRIFLNNGSVNSTPANNIYLGQINLPVTTNSETASLFAPYFPLNMWVPAGYKINVTIGTAVAAGYYVSVQGGNY